MANANTDKDRSVPNLDNATPMSIIDELGKIRVESARLKFLEGIYKQALEARAALPELEGLKPVMGEKYIGTYSTITQERIDTDAVRALLTPEQLKLVTKVTTFRQLSTKPNPLTQSI